MTNPAPANPFAGYAVPTPDPATVTTPAPVTVAPTQNPATVSPGAVDQAAAYQAFLAEQARIQQAAAAQAAPAAPPVDQAFLAWQAAQQGQTMTAPVATVTPPQFIAPVPPTAAPTSGGSDPFDDPAPPRPKGPRLDEMAGRLLLIIPKGMDKASSKETDGTTSTYDRMTADVVVLDGPPMAYGGKPNGRPPVPHDKVAPIPWREVGMFISAKALISQSRNAWEKRQRGEPGMVIGRLGYGEQPADPKLQAPWILTTATEADKALARAYLATIDPFA
jgi:hypothetical protein